MNRIGGHAREVLAIARFACLAVVRLPHLATARFPHSATVRLPVVEHAWLARMLKSASLVLPLFVRRPQALER